MSELRRCQVFLAARLRHGSLPSARLLESWRQAGGSATTYYRGLRDLGLREVGGLVRLPEAVDPTRARACEGHRPLLSIDAGEARCLKCGRRYLG